MNAADSERMKGILEGGGYAFVNDECKADIILFNTCSVRQLAEEKVWSKLGAMRRGKILGVVGCMAQQYGDKIFKKAPNVDLVCGTYRFHKIGELLEKAAAGKRVVDVECMEGDLGSNGIGRRSDKICAFVPISRGCNNKCSYCIVPHVRGPERNRSLSEIVDEVKSLGQNGYKEITLLGQNVNSYKDDRYDFVNLLEELNKINDIERIRFITSHPKDTGLNLFKTIGELSKICESVHLPVQSGSDRILKKMNRGYNKEHYLELIKKLREIVPGVSISTDIIVGFPGETDEDYEDTYNLVKETEFDGAFVFKYSTRPGTTAEKFKDDVAIDKKRERNQKLLKLLDEIGLKKNKLLNNKVLEVLVGGISKNNKNRLMGKTRTNKIVVFEAADNINLLGRIVHVKIIDVSPHTLIGKLWN